MSTNGHPPQERPTLRRIHALPSPCKSCGVEATMLITVHALVPERTILLPAVGIGRNSGGAQPATMGAGIEAHLLCLHCLRREHWTPNGQDWASTLVDPGANNYDADTAPS